MSPSNDTHDIFRGVSQHDPTVLEGLLMSRLENQAASGLDPKTYAMVNIAALIAVDAAPASFIWQVGIALESGVTPEEILGLLVALNPVLGNARIVAAAPELAIALGVDLDLADEEA
jgi:alkylhydroperoxidase/carboxymuconolactone decarboxylase family protein YurZ